MLWDALQGHSKALSLAFIWLADDLHSSSEVEKKVVNLMKINEIRELSNEEMIKKIFIGVIKFYRMYLSPLKPPCCRFYPTCSAYALEAIQKHGAFKGTALAIYRILRCNPFCKGGYDPVP